MGFLSVVEHDLEQTIDFIVMIMRMYCLIFRMISLLIFLFSSGARTMQIFQAADSLCAISLRVITALYRSYPPSSIAETLIVRVGCRFRALGPR